MIKIAIADDHQIFIDGIKALLQNEDDYNVVLEANDGQELLDKLKDSEIDIVLMDISMPKLDGIDTINIMRKDFPDHKVIVLTMHRDIKYIENLLKIGVEGYLLKNCGKDELKDAIDSTLEGKSYYSQDISSAYMEHINNRPKEEDIDVKLTKREKEILGLIAEDFTSNEIAEKLFISIYTVEAHRKNLLNKFKVRSSVGLVKSAVEHNLLGQEGK